MFIVIRPFNLETAVGRVRVCGSQASWLGATTRQRRPLVGGATTPGGLGVPLGECQESSVCQFNGFLQRAISGQLRFLGLMVRAGLRTHSNLRRFYHFGLQGVADHRICVAINARKFETSSSHATPRDDPHAMSAIVIGPD